MDGSYGASGVGEGWCVLGVVICVGKNRAGRSRASGLIPVVSFTLCVSWGGVVFSCQVADWTRKTACM